MQGDAKGAKGCQEMPMGAKGAKGCQEMPMGAKGCQEMPMGAKGCQEMPMGAKGARDAKGAKGCHVFGQAFARGGPGRGPTPREKVFGVKR